MDEEVITGKIEKEGMPEEIQEEIEKDIKNKTKIKQDNKDIYKYIIIASGLIILFLLFKKHE